MTILEHIKRQFVQQPAESTSRSNTGDIPTNISRPDFKSFEEVYKTSYSHGLEAIYSLETVDLRTVKRIGEPSSVASLPAIPVQKDFQNRNEFTQETSRQCQFDFGTAFSERMDSFVLEEPIQVLGLSKHAERCLLAQGLFRIQDLIKSDLSKFVYLKGMGQGHIDETQHRVKSYVEGLMLYQCTTIDFSAWMRSLFSTFNSKKMYVLLESYQLSHLFTLSPAESVEVRLLTFEKRQEWREEMMMEINLKREQVIAGMHRVVSAFIKPWMVRRHGVATRSEIVERLQRLSDRPVMAELTLDFFSKIYFEGRFAFADWFVTGGDHLFFCDHVVNLKYDAVIDKAKTYFYKGGISYGFAELTQLIAREFAMEWVDYSEEFIEKCLRSSTTFRVRKGDKSRLFVRLA